MGLVSPIRVQMISYNQSKPQDSDSGSFLWQWEMGASGRKIGASRAGKRPASFELQTVSRFLLWLQAPPWFAFLTLPNNLLCLVCPIDFGLTCQRLAIRSVKRFGLAHVCSAANVEPESAGRDAFFSGCETRHYSGSPFLTHSPTTFCVLVSPD